MSAEPIAPHTVERVTWPEALRRMDWRQGEHVTLIGPTGRGKTELTIELLKERTWVVFLGTKREDETQDRLKRAGYRTIRDSRQLNPEIDHYFILRPPFPKVDPDVLKAQHARVFRDGLMTAFRQTGWTVAADEAVYICHYLGLSEDMKLLWLQGRSQGNSVICNTQRSRFIPLEAYSSATHLFVWTDPDQNNIRRNAELTGFNYHQALDAMQVMTKHDVLYVNTVTGEMVITNTRWDGR